MYGKKIHGFFVLHCKVTFSAPLWTAYDAGSWFFCYLDMELG